MNYNIYYNVFDMLNEEVLLTNSRENEIDWPEIPFIDLRTGPKGSEIYDKYRQIAERAAIVKNGLKGLPRILREDIPEDYIAISPAMIKRNCVIKKPSGIKKLEEDFIYSIIILLEDKTTKSAIGEVYISRPKNNSRDTIVVRKKVFDSFLENKNIEVNEDNMRLDFLESRLRNLYQRYPKIAEEIFDNK